MKLINKLLKLFVILDDKQFNMKHYHENAQTMDRYALMHLEELDCLAKKMINSLDLINYKYEEDRVFNENYAFLTKEFGNEDFAKQISKVLMFSRVALLYVSVLIEMPSQGKKEKIVSKLKIAEELLVHTVLKRYKENGLEMHWNGFEFCFNFKCLPKDAEIIDAVKQMIWLNNMVSRAVDDCSFLEFIKLLDCLKAKNIVSGKSKQAFYSNNQHV